ncbi:MAG: 2OG-Fe(II) oxygenase [Gammaproteobacteria bacterium]|nr:2OG-Fe(II) oxygenase [Gammaproteobacteria bacterium]
MKTPDQIFNDNLYIERNSDLTAVELQAIDRYLHDLLAADSDHLRTTHYFHGRYENIYLDQVESTELARLLDESRQLAAELIEVDPAELSIGFWFNLMQPGQITDWHTHDDLDELVSGVVYLTVPEVSGKLVLKDDTGQVEVEPTTGQFVFFAPQTPHAVGENKSSLHRLSIGMNFGLKSTSPSHLAS